MVLGRTFENYSRQAAQKKNLLGTSRSLRPGHSRGRMAHQRLLAAGIFQTLDSSAAVCSSCADGLLLRLPLADNIWGNPFPADDQQQLPELRCQARRPQRCRRRPDRKGRPRPHVGAAAGVPRVVARLDARPRAARVCDGRHARGAGLAGS